MQFGRPGYRPATRIRDASVGRGIRLAAIGWPARVPRGVRVADSDHVTGREDIAKPSSGPSLQVPPSPPPGCDASRWMTASVHVERALPLPPVPVVTSIRIGTHPDCGYDRIVVHLRGPVPGYDIKYVSRTAAGPAARMIATRGDHYLLLTLHPAQGHLPSGVSTISPASAAVAFPVLRGYSVSSDFEGALCLVVVVAKAAAFRVGRLSGRLYVDVAG